MNLRHWVRKFRCAGMGIKSGARGQSSFVVHFSVSLLVLIFATILRCEVWQWCVLLLCIALVISLEYMNSALEHLAKGLCRDHNEDVGAALDMASAAVLVASIASVLIGVLVIGNQFLKWLM
jgi:diacylglycerol kinase